MKYYLNNADSGLSYDTDGVNAGEPMSEQRIDAWPIMQAMEDLAPIYSGYSGQVTTYNALAATYNTAVTAYNTEIKDSKVKEEDRTVIPEKPCPPTMPVAWSGFEIVTNSAYLTAPVGTLALYLAANSGAVLVYDMLNTAAAPNTPTPDSYRFGYVSVVKDTSIASLDIAYDVTAQASHIFGRLGQGEKTMPGNSAPFRWAAENS